jgi:hypothetical protein
VETQPQGIDVRRQLLFLEAFIYRYHTQIANVIERDLRRYSDFGNQRTASPKLPMKWELLRGCFRSNEHVLSFQRQLLFLFQPAATRGYRDLLERVESLSYHSANSATSTSAKLYLGELLQLPDLDDVNVSHHQESNVLNDMKARVEDSTEQEWNWWPLSPRRRPLLAGEICLSWTCVGFLLILPHGLSYRCRFVAKKGHAIFPKDSGISWVLGCQFLPEVKATHHPLYQFRTLPKLRLDKFVMHFILSRLDSRMS